MTVGENHVRIKPPILMVKGLNVSNLFWACLRSLSQMASMALAKAAMVRQMVLKLFKNAEDGDERLGVRFVLCS